MSDLKIGSITPSAINIGLTGVCRVMQGAVQVWPTGTVPTPMHHWHMRAPHMTLDGGGDAIGLTDTVAAEDMFIGGSLTPWPVTLSNPSINNKPHVTMSDSRMETIAPHYFSNSKTYAFVARRPAMQDTAIFADIGGVQQDLYLQTGSFKSQNAMLNVLVDSNWHYYIVQRINGDSKVWIDGVLLQSTASTIFDGSGNAAIGGPPTELTSGVEIADLRIHNGMISMTDRLAIEAYYQAEFGL